MTSDANLTPERRAQLEYCRDVLHPRILELQGVMWRSLTPWQWPRWFLARRQARKLQDEWKAILDERTA